MRLALVIVVTQLAGQLVGSALVAGCGQDDVAACRVGVDCASGVCRSDGTCAPNDTTRADGDAAPTSPDATSADADATMNATDQDAAADIPSGACVPVDDDRVSRAEVPLAAGLYATFRIATDVAVDLVGEVTGDRRAWDLDGPYDGDVDERVELRAVTGSWYATHFPGATYAARLSSAEDYLGVFELTDAALLLRGVVSPEDGLFATRLTYDPPVVVLRFPLAVGETWSTVATVTGVTLGVPTLVTERYDSEVDARGALATPFGDFDVLRVKTKLTRTVGLAVTSIRQMAFVAPCFGTVALVVSGAGESASEFDQAAEIRRLAP